MRIPSAPDLFADALVPGFLYQPDILSVADESHFVRQFQALSFKPFEFHGYLGNRRIVSFGWRYDYAGQRLQKSDVMPDFLLPLRNLATELSGIETTAFEHALITEYAPGAGIGWHRDKPMFHHVVAFSFLAACRLRFRRRREEGWARHSMIIEPRSGYMLDGEARSQWGHSIPAVEQTRYSVTFRDFYSEAIAPGPQKR
jgi:alkylated DNA repair dioxygenase AlkB